MAKETLTIDTFLQNLERQFDDGSSEWLTPEAQFRNLPGWTSLQSLVVIISFDEDYGVNISADELQRAQTLGDLYELIKENQGT